MITQRFHQWNKTRQYNFRCTQCDTQLRSTQETADHIGHCHLENGIYGDGVFCEYPLCGSRHHTILNCNLVTAWCQHCERRGHLPFHHSQHDLVYLENCYLWFEAYSLKPGFRLLTAGRHLAPKITTEMWRFSLYALTPKELPKMELMQPQKDFGADVTALTPEEKQFADLQKRFYNIASTLSKG